MDWVILIMGRLGHIGLGIGIGIGIGIFIF